MTQLRQLFEYRKIKDTYKRAWDVPYDILLQTMEWNEFRQKIISRDNNKCTICHKLQSEKIGNDYYRKLTEEEIIENAKERLIDLFDDGVFFKISSPGVDIIRIYNPIILHVHHKYYIHNQLPWEYLDKAIITICHDCHFAIHATKKIPVYADDSFKIILYLDPCIRCNGTGFLQQFRHVENGICFKCNGSKYENYSFNW